MDKFLCIFLLIVVLTIIGGIWWDVAVWHECRNDGHSLFYCWRMISR